MAEGGKPGHILVPDIETVPPKLSQSGIHINRVPKHDDVDDQSQGAELVFLALAITLPQLAVLAVEGGPRQHVPRLAAIELNQNPAAISLIVEEIQ